MTEAPGDEDERARFRPAWSCFPAGAPPEPVVVGWRTLHGLPPAALHNLWQLLVQALNQPDEADSRQLLEAYAQRYEASPSSVLAAVRACDFLLRQAASLSVDEADFRADLDALSAPGQTAGIELLIPRYLEMRDQLRARLIESTLADHGNVLVGVDWRVDHVQVSSHGRMDAIPVVFLNLRYRAGEETKNLGLQLSPAAVVSLKDLLTHLATQ